jgi:nitric oxide dioxygenase
MHDLTAEDIGRIRVSFDQLWSVSAETMTLFYDRLFELAPDTHALFKSDMDEQKKKFMSMLAMIVGNLDNVRILLPATRNLARHHVDFGVHAGHYEVVGEALMWSLRQGLGPHWTPSTAESWNRAYRSLTADMIQHAHG